VGVRSGYGGHLTCECGGGLIPIATSGGEGCLGRLGWLGGVTVEGAIDKPALEEVPRPHSIA
jgi:hypothetical protein